ncbi:hypothetical protein [Brucella thiophenivorans]|uniref:Uncharacterized protein n=1 Tax=Brucella thiophenivorans TaxID=571255 RepID=A0A256FE40_9HYPH|nr:hypothetical protein [Brucella thiophenivorans]OYR13048.1 hypothetical protein CEV31_3529 [Brucella thiophenivorans]
MDNAFARFSELLQTTLIPEYCTHPTMGMTPQGFKNDVHKLSLTDIELFMHAWDIGFIQYAGNGSYRLGRANATEKLFWEGPKSVEVRGFSLWLEPIITVAVLARMHIDLGWPVNLIGAQSKGDWAFDAVIYRNAADENGYVLCEVKKTAREVDQLATNMREYIAVPPVAEDSLKGAKLNAYRKVKALRARQPAFLWLAGPDKYDMTYKVNYNGSLTSLEPVSIDVMSFSKLAFS